MTISVVWPREFRPKSLMFQEDAPDRGGITSIDGTEQVVASPGGRWIARMSWDVFGPPGNTWQQNRMLFFRAMPGLMQGRVGRCLIGPYDWMTPAGMAGIDALAFLANDDGTLNSDGSPWQQSAVTAILHQSATPQDQSVTFAIDPGFNPQAGQYIGLGGNRLHKLTSVQPMNGSDGTGREIYTAAIWPWLRDSYGAGSDVEFEDPLCEMKFKAANTAALDIQAPWKASVQIDFVEAFDGF